MGILHKIHNRCVALYTAIPVCTILFTIVCAKFLHFLPPFQLVAAVICLTPLVSTFMRLRLWQNRKAMLTREELDSRTAKVFFSAIPVEISFSVIAMGFILFS